ELFTQPSFTINALRLPCAVLKSKSRKTMSRVVSGAVFLICIFSIRAFAQFDTADVLGTERDGSGAVIARANLTLQNESTGISAKITSDAAGNYNFLNIKAGTYTISSDREGFRTFTSSHIAVNVGARQRADITLEVGIISETVEVTGAA